MLTLHGIRLKQNIISVIREIRHGEVLFVVPNFRHGPSLFHCCSHIELLLFPLKLRMSILIVAGIHHFSYILLNFV